MSRKERFESTRAIYNSKSKTMLQSANEGKQTKKIEYPLLKGPYNRAKIKLSTASTMSFKCKGFKLGRYALTEAGDTRLIWEEYLV